jgi:hypothetical protein
VVLPEFGVDVDGVEEDGLEEEPVPVVELLPVEEPTLPLLLLD